MLPYLTKAEIDAVYGGVGRTGTPYDRKRVFYNLMGYTGTLIDQERAWLSALGYSTGSLRQRWSELLTASGYTGTLGDKFRSCAVNAGTNLLTRSEEFDHGDWPNNNVTTTANDTTAPDGTSTADKFLETAITGVHDPYHSYALSAVNYAFSVFAKGGLGRDWIALRINGVTAPQCHFNLSTGAVGTAIGGAIGYIYPCSNDWYRCTVVGNPGELSGFAAIYIATSDGIISYLGDVTKGIFVWGAQLEVGSFASPYKPRTT